MSRALAALAVATVAGALAVAVLRRRWTVVTVVGGSMLPALQDGDVLLARRLRPDRARVGDVLVIAAPTPDGGQDRMVKRVAAVPGDPLQDGVPGTGPVPAGSLVVLGDNGGYDSRMFGPLPYERVLGAVVRPLPGASAAPSGREYVRLDDLRDDPLLDLLAPGSG